MNLLKTKRENGVYFTASNPFDNPAFKKWASSAKLPKSSILEPFAGENSLIEFLRDMKLCEESTSYDINPCDPEVRERDTLKRFPSGFSVCVTNPPWLAKNSATRRGLPYPNIQYDDLYKYAVEKCLENCDWVAALVPESFIRSGLFHKRLSQFVSLTVKLFEDTESPVGLALFKPNPSKEITVWSGSKKIGYLSQLEKLKPSSENMKIPVRFNDPKGNVGLIAIDNHNSESIRFCEPEVLKDYPVRETCRSITKLMVGGNVKIKQWNDWIREFRKNTKDVLLTSFKGIRKDGMYRRRMDFDLTRRIVNEIQ